MPQSQSTSIQNNKRRRREKSKWQISQLVHSAQTEELHTNTSSIKIRRKHLQSTLIISKSKGPAKTLRDIRTSTYQMCRIEENTKRTTKFHKWTCNLTPLIRTIYWKYCGKGEKLLLRSNFSPYPQYFITWCWTSMLKLGSEFLFEISGYSR